MKVVVAILWLLLFAWFCGVNLFMIESTPGEVSSDIEIENVILGTVCFGGIAFLVGLLMVWPTAGYCYLLLDCSAAGHSPFVRRQIEAQFAEKNIHFDVAYVACFFYLFLGPLICISFEHVAVAVFMAAIGTVAVYIAVQCQLVPAISKERQVLAVIKRDAAAVAERGQEERRIMVLQQAQAEVEKQQQMTRLAAARCVEIENWRLELTELYLLNREYLKPHYLDEITELADFCKENVTGDWDRCLKLITSCRNKILKTSAGIKIHRYYKTFSPAIDTVFSQEQFDRQLNAILRLEDFEPIENVLGKLGRFREMIRNLGESHSLQESSEAVKADKLEAFFATVLNDGGPASPVQRAENHDVDEVDEASPFISPNRARIERS